jgi:uncharacterized protein YecT (DUF1311 family)
VKTERCSFLKKRTKKLLRYAATTGSAGAKVFCFFFSKKKAFFPLLALTGCVIHHVQPYHPETLAAPDTQDAAASSTNCFEASSTAERLACAQPALTAANRTLTETLQARLRMSDPFGRDVLLAAQRTWLLGLPDACHLPAAADQAGPDAVACLGEQFRRQTAALAAWQVAAAPAPAMSQYVHFKIAPGAAAMNPAFCQDLARDMNAALAQTGSADPAAIAGAREIAGTHGPDEGSLAGQTVRVDERLANAFGGFARRARDVAVGGAPPLLDTLSLGKLLQTTADNQGGRFSAYASQTGDYGAAEVFTYQGRTVALLEDAWGFDAPAAPGEFAHAGAWALSGGAAAPACLFETFQMPAEAGGFDALTAFAAWRDALAQLRDSAAPPLGVSFLRDQGQIRAETDWLVLHMPLVVSEQARRGGWVPWLRLRHDAVLDALFAWAQRDPAHQTLFDRMFALLKPAAQDLVRGYQQLEALDAAEAKAAAGVAVMELLYGATVTVAPDLGADLQAPASATGHAPRYPILATPALR